MFDIVLTKNFPLIDCINTALKLNIKKVEFYSKLQLAAI